MKKRGKLRSSERAFGQHLLDMSFPYMSAFLNHLSYRGFKEQSHEFRRLIQDLNPLRMYICEVEEIEEVLFEKDFHRTVMNLELPFKCFLKLLELDETENSDLREHILQMLKRFQEVRDSLPERCPEYRGENNESRPI